MLLQFEQSDIEPGREQPAQIGLQRRQQLVVAARAQQEAAQIDQELPAVRDGGELGQQPHPRRLQRTAQRRLGGGAFGRVIGRLYRGVGGGHRVGIGIEAGERAQEFLAPGFIQALVGLRQLGGAIARADLAATTLQAGPHLRGDRLVRHARRHIAPCHGDAADGAIEQTGDGDITHADVPCRGQRS